MTYNLQGLGLILRNRFSPKQALVAAFITACCSQIYACGFRGKYHPPAPRFTMEQSLRLFLVVLAASFLVFYPLRLLGVHFGWLGGKGRPASPTDTSKRD